MRLLRESNIVVVVLLFAQAVRRSDAVVENKKALYSFSGRFMAYERENRKMRLIGNGTKLRLILGGGERLEGHSLGLRGLSATSSKLEATADKSGRALPSPSVSRRPVT